MTKRKEFLLDPVVNIFSLKHPCDLVQYAYDIIVYWVLFLLISSAGAMFHPFLILGILLFPAFVLGGFTATSRRLYDAGYSIKYMTLVLIPVIGILILLIPLVHPTNNELRDYEKKEREHYEKTYY